MLEKFNHLAELSAMNVCRRGFLHRLGGGAMFVATAAGGLLSCSGTARAGRETRVCSTESSFASCRGLPVNSPCIASGGVEGRCVVTASVDGQYYCNECRVKGSKKCPNRGC